MHQIINHKSTKSQDYKELCNNKMPSQMDVALLYIVGEMGWDWVSLDVVSYRATYKVYPSLWANLAVQQEYRGEC